jgi:hypothetical protein
MNQERPGSRRGGKTFQKLRGRSISDQMDTSDGSQRLLSSKPTPYRKKTLGPTLNKNRTSRHSSSHSNILKISGISKKDEAEVISLLSLKIKQELKLKEVFC